MKQIRLLEPKNFGVILVSGSDSKRNCPLCVIQKPTDFIIQGDQMIKVIDSLGHMEDSKQVLDRAVDFACDADQVLEIKRG